MSTRVVVGRVATLDAKCPECKGILQATIESAAHDSALLDIQVRCIGKCKKFWNTFVELKKWF